MKFLSRRSMKPFYLIGSIIFFFLFVTTPSANAQETPPSTVPDKMQTMCDYEPDGPWCDDAEESTGPDSSDGYTVTTPVPPVLDPPPVPVDASAVTSTTAYNPFIMGAVLGVVILVASLGMMGYFRSRAGERFSRSFAEHAAATPNGKMAEGWK